VIDLSLTLDYEIRGDGRGDVDRLIVQPTRRFLDLCEREGCRATLFVEVAELMRMEREPAHRGALARVRRQLRDAHAEGHDLQLHIHPQWFHAQYIDGLWSLNESVTTLAQLGSEAAGDRVRAGRDFLAELLAPTRRPYLCEAFRAGGWAMQPTRPIFDALTSAGITVDSSVFKGGRGPTEAAFDYSGAASHVYPWYFDPDDVSRVDPRPGPTHRCLEMPIYAEPRAFVSFLTRKRYVLERHRQEDSFPGGLPLRRSAAHGLSVLRTLGSNAAMKLDFCRCNRRELRSMLHRIGKLAPREPGASVPVVAIGHSKDFVFDDDFADFLKTIRTRYGGVIRIVPLTEAARRFREVPT
jgi:hypothetical protein